MLQKKICMLGDFAVGKTSLVARYVKSVFSDKYLTTVGVKIDKKIVSSPSGEVMLILWDLAGEDEFLQVRMSYLRGAAGYLLVVDGTNRATLDTALTLSRRVEEAHGSLPMILVLNKADLVDEWEIDQAATDELRRNGRTVILTSAKTGLGVEEAFLALVEKFGAD